MILLPLAFPSKIFFAILSSLIRSTFPNQLSTFFFCNAHVLLPYIIVSVQTCSCADVSPSHKCVNISCFSSLMNTPKNTTSTCSNILPFMRRRNHGLASRPLLISFKNQKLYLTRIPAQTFIFMPFFHVTNACNSHSDDAMSTA